MPTARAQTYPSQTFNNLLIHGSVISSQTGSGTALGAIFSANRTINTPPSSSDSPLSDVTVNLGFSGGHGVTESAVNAILNDFGSTHGGPNAAGWAAAFTANTNSVIPPGARFTSDFAIQTGCKKANPSGGLPMGATLRGCESHWDIAYGPNNQFSSMTGVLTAQEYDWNGNGVDDVGAWNPWELMIGTRTPIASGGWPLFIEQGLYAAPSDDASYVWLGNWAYYSGNFAHAVLDLETAASSAPRITSATPDAAVITVTVNNVMPLGGGDTTTFGPGGIGSAFGKTKTAIATANRAKTIFVSDTTYLRPGMFVYDISTALAGVPIGTTIASVSSPAELVLSKIATINNGDVLLFAQAQKRVTIGGHPYTVAGVTLTRAGSVAGTAYFTSRVTAADATKGGLIYPNSHAIWLCAGSATTPWCDIAFNRSGSASLRSDGGTGILSTAPLTVPGLTNTGNETVSGARADTSATVVTPVTGFSTTIGNNISRYIVDPARALASGTITMPAAPIADQLLRIDFTKGITSFTLNANVGQMVNGAPTSARANTSVAFIYVGKTWIREQ